MADLVGMIVEMTDDIGKQLTYAVLEKQGMPRHEIPELIASCCKNAIPTFKCVVSFQTARKILPITSETALQNLTATRKPGFHWIVVVGGGGNSYAQVSVGSAVPDDAVRGSITGPESAPVERHDHCEFPWPEPPGQRTRHRCSTDRWLWDGH